MPRVLNLASEVIILSNASYDDSYAISKNQTADALFFGVHN